MSDDARQIVLEQALEDLWLWASEQRIFLDNDPVPDGLGSRVLAALGGGEAEQQVAMLTRERDEAVGSWGVLYRGQVSRAAKLEAKVATLTEALQEEQQARKVLSHQLQKRAGGNDALTVNLRTQVEALTEALEKYGEHMVGCGSEMAEDCDCGFESALAAVRGEK